MRLKIFVRADMIGSGKIDLLRRVGETGSISAAARSMGMGYRRAWYLLGTLQNCFDAPLFVTSRGGSRAGGTSLTELGQELLMRFAAEEERLRSDAGGFLQWLESRQPADHSAIDRR